MSSKNDDTKPFSIKCDKTIFNKTEIAILEKRGDSPPQYFEEEDKEE